MQVYFEMPVPLMLTWDLHTGTDGKQTSPGVPKDSQQQNTSQQVGRLLSVQLSAACVLHPL